MPCVTACDSPYAVCHSVWFTICRVSQHVIHHMPAVMNHMPAAMRAQCSPAALQKEPASTEHVPSTSTRCIKCSTHPFPKPSFEAMPCNILHTSMHGIALEHDRTAGFCSASISVSNCVTRPILKCRICPCR